MTVSKNSVVEIDNLSSSKISNPTYRRIRSGNYDYKSAAKSPIVKKLDHSELEAIEELYCESQCIYTGLEIESCRCGIHIQKDIRWRIKFNLRRLYKRLNIANIQCNVVLMKIFQV